jgi:hypothetical protein
MFKKGDLVKVKHTLMSGEVIDAAIGDQANVMYLVGYTDNDGEAQQRYFEVDQIEAA